MSKKTLTIAGIAGASATALFTYLAYSDEPPREGVVLNAHSLAALRAASAPLLAASTPVTEASAPVGSTLQTSFASGAPGLDPAKIRDAKTYFERFKTASGASLRFTLLRSTMREIGNNPQNAHLLGTTPEALVALVRSESQLMANMLVPMVGVKIDGKFPVTQDYYRALDDLRYAEAQLSLQTDGSYSPGSNWHMVVGEGAKSTTPSELNDYQREIGIGLAAQAVNRFTSLYKAEEGSTERRSQSLYLMHLEEAYRYGRRAELNAAPRNVWAEIGASREELEKLIKQYNGDRPLPSPFPS